jgi:hypothetical protein
VTWAAELYRVMAKLEHKANERGWTVVYRLSDNAIGVTRKDPTRPGKYRPGYEEAMRLVDARMVDAVLCFKWDRFIREPLDLEYLIPRFDKAGVRFAEMEGSIDLGTDSGRLHARIMIAVAKAEQERKAERQKLAFERAAINGKRFTGCAGSRRCWAGWLCARAGTWSPACQVTPAITFTGAPRPPATGPITGGTWPGRSGRWRSSSANSSWPGCRARMRLIW